MVRFSFPTRNAGEQGKGAGEDEGLRDEVELEEREGRGAPPPFDCAELACPAPAELAGAELEGCRDDGDRCLCGREGGAGEPSGGASKGAGGPGGPSDGDLCEGEGGPGESPDGAVDPCEGNDLAIGDPERFRRGGPSVACCCSGGDDPPSAPGVTSESAPSGAGEFGASAASFAAVSP